MSVKELEAATALGARGFAVYPVSNNKRPRTKHGHNDASKDPEQIRDMWMRVGGPLIGVRTGEASNAAVLDIDKQHGGLEWWQENRQRLPLTRIHRTRSGGLHLWFLHRPGLRNVELGKLGIGIEARGEGGSAIWWPAAGLPVLDDAPLAPWPEWLIPPPRPTPAPYEHTGPRPAAHIEASFMGIIRAVATSPSGTRNQRLFWGAARCAEMAARGELSRRHAEAALIEAASRTGLDRMESLQTIGSAFRRVA